MLQYLLDAVNAGAQLAPSERKRTHRILADRYGDAPGTALAFSDEEEQEEFESDDGNSSDSEDIVPPSYWFREWDPTYNSDMKGMSPMLHCTCAVLMNPCTTVCTQPIEVEGLEMMKDSRKYLCGRRYHQ